MSAPLNGKRIAVVETRRLDEFAGLLEKEGAVPLRFPLIAIHDQPDEGPVLEWLRDFLAGRFHATIFMTGEGIRRLAGFAERADCRDDYVRALADNFTLVRGPKPVLALKELGVAPGKVSPAPTSEGVIEALKERDLAGKTVGVQLFEEAKPDLADFLASAGATVRPVYPYVYDPAVDESQVVELIGVLSRGEADVFAVTSSPQLTRLFEVAEQRGLADELRSGLDRVCVAAVGPVAEEAFVKRGIRVDVCPEKGGFVMKKLVEYLKRHFAGRATP